MRKNFYILALLFLVSFLMPSAVSAHILKYSGTIGAVLHVDPDDDPIVGQPTYFFFEFKDKANKFEPSDCDCRVKITEGDKELFSGDLFSGNPNPSLTNASFSFVFPGTDIYKLTVEGRPKTADSFKEFSLIYDIRVARTSDSQPSQTPWLNNHKWHIITPVAVATFTGIIYILLKKKHK